MDSLILSGLNVMSTRDRYLLDVNSSERSITHRLALYYEGLFPEWDVDCEYNRNMRDPKIINISPQDFLRRMADGIELDIGSERTAILRNEQIEQEDIAALKSQLTDPKRVIYDDELDLLSFVLELRDGKELVKPIYPDIIIHSRGEKKNRTVVELKKSSNSDKRSRAYDLVKLSTLVSSSEYRYKYGYFIDVPTGNDYRPSPVYKIEKDRLMPAIRKIRFA